MDLGPTVTQCGLLPTLTRLYLQRLNFQMMLLSQFLEEAARVGVGVYLASTAGSPLPCKGEQEEQEEVTQQS